MFKYNCLNPIAKVGLDNFGAGYVKCDELNDADCVLVRSAKMHGMELPDRLMAIARAGAGVNNIPLDDCARRGIVVFNTPGANANGVKELVIAGMLLASRGIVDGIEWLETQKKNKNVAKDAEAQKKQYAGSEIEGKKLGIIGLGAIGVKVANTAVNLGMEVLGYDPYISVDAAWHLSRSIKHALSVEEIYANCDYITIHVPLMDSTRKMINSESIKLMKNDAILLNFARDELVDEEAVVSALKVGKLRRYVSDFPNPTTVGQEGCIVIPHLGASTEESEDNCAVMAVKELMDYMENGNIKNSVNFPPIAMGVCETASRVIVFHQNKANTITRFSAIFGEAGINIAEMNNKSKGDNAVSMFDLDSVPSEDIFEKIRALDGVYRLRVVKA
ncbi:MAG: 3-phosphoglycerate dehydrogenase [Lachnospiraceae bacterium]|nr:3-phosphoglycerate dehydrogenase [Lachnospiraceae bacterium]